MAENGAGFVGMNRSPEEAEERIARWERSFQEKAQRYQAVARDAEDIRSTASSSDGRVRVTVGPDGSITDLEFSEKIRSMPLRDLSTWILDTMRRAQSEIAGRMGSVMTEHLGDEDQQTRALMLDTLRERFPEQVSEPQPPEASARWDFDQRDESGEQAESGDASSASGSSGAGSSGVGSSGAEASDSAAPPARPPSSEPRRRRGEDDGMEDFGDDFDPLRD